MARMHTASATRTGRCCRGRRSATVSPRVNFPVRCRGSAISSSTIIQATVVPPRYISPSYPVRATSPVLPSKVAADR
jgi:hypothetical protein